MAKRKRSKRRSGTPAGGRPPAGSPTAGLTIARSRKMAAEAQLTELALREREGSLVPIEHVRQIEAVRREELRARLLAIPGKWAPRMVAVRSTAEAQARLEDIVNDALSSLREAGGAIRDRLASGEPAAAPSRRRGRPRGPSAHPKAHRKRLG